MKVINNIIMGCIHSRSRRNDKIIVNREQTISFTVTLTYKKFQKNNKRLPIIYEVPSLLEFSLNT